MHTVSFSLAFYIVLRPQGIRKQMKTLRKRHHARLVASLDVNEPCYVTNENKQKEFKPFGGQTSFADRKWINFFASFLGFAQRMLLTSSIV